MALTLFLVNVIVDSALFKYEVQHHGAGGRKGDAPVAHGGNHQIDDRQINILFIEHILPLCFLRFIPSLFFLRLVIFL